MSRKLLPNRRRNVTAKFEHSTGVASRKFIVSVGFFQDGTPAELFLNTEQKAGSEADVNASDAAVAVSLALQYGCPIDVIRSAMKRNVDGGPMGPVAHALDVASDITTEMAWTG